MLKIVKYSERSVAIFGDTKPWAPVFKTVGKFNKFLTNPETQQKEAGWVFSAKAEQNVQALLDAGLEAATAKVVAEAVPA